MQITKTNLWPTQLYHTVVDLEKERSWLLDKLEELKFFDCPSKSGIGGNTTRNAYQPEYNLFEDSSEEMKSIYEKIVSPLSEEFWIDIASNNINIPNNARLIHKAWLVEYSEGSWQDLHNHKTSIFTGVWTIFCDEQKQGCGEFHIHNPNIVSHNLGFCQAVKKIQTKLNDLYIIPAWIYHNVTPTSARRVVFVWDTIAVPY